MPGDLRFDWDSLKAAGTRAKHGVSFEEALTAFGDPLGRITDDPRHAEGEERSALLGQSERRRLLVVMFTERGEAIQPDHRAEGDAESTEEG